MGLTFQESDHTSFMVSVQEVVGSEEPTASPSTKRQRMLNPVPRMMSAPSQLPAPASLGGLPAHLPHTHPGVTCTTVVAVVDVMVQDLA